MSLKGRLETFGFSIILQLLADDQKTGVLWVSNGEDDSRIFMKDGIIAYAVSSQKTFGLARLLKANEIISPQNLRECLHLAKNDNQKLSRILVEKGYLSMESLKKVLNYQVKEIIFSAFLWKTGKFDYKDVPLDVEGKLVTSINIVNIIMEASRRVDEWAAITEQISDDKLIFRILREDGSQKEFKLSRKGKRIFSLIDGKRTAKQLVNDSGFDEFSTYKILHSWLLSGLIGQSEDALKQEDYVSDYSGIIGIINDILTVIYKDLEPVIGNRALSLFDECKTELAPEQRSVFEAFGLKKQSGTNVLALLEDMNAFKDFNEGRKFLIEGFRQILTSILGKETKILGIKITKGTLKKMGEILSYVKEYQENSHENRIIVTEIGIILAKASKRLQTKKKK